MERSYSGHRSRKLLKHIEENFLVQVLRKPTRKALLLELLFVNRDELRHKLGISGCLGHNGHVVEFQIIGVRRETASKTSALNMETADFWLLKELAAFGAYEITLNLTEVLDPVAIPTMVDIQMSVKFGFSRTETMGDRFLDEIFDNAEFQEVILVYAESQLQ
ncbi:hypothetical protein WISP_67690 [Willisornis vidua]|uniref:Uncharacterized protein n=1 Tax=Willisornis vidua TaxID=1566151 RepID=A0ABQ9DDL4_9PASS|nr:hypothetical protein WISP_67690 [Willisornis vidua]